MKPLRKSLFLTALLVACGDDGPTEPTPGTDNFVISVAPLQLDEIIQACYSVEVWNGQGGAGTEEAPNELVWARQLCSLQYGNGPGGDLSYVGPCDAQAGLHTVTLTLDRLDGAPLGSWLNPCPAEAPCVIEAPCVENSDVPVTFNLIVMRQANQGFFDVAVNILGVFCAAKFDTCYPGEEDAAGEVGPETPILLLVAADGLRHHTGILAVSCTQGYAARGPVHMYMSPIVFDCGEAYSATLDPAAGPGLAYDPPLSHTSGEVWQYAVYSGLESQSCDDEDGLSQPCPAVFWNLPFGIEGLPPGCRIQATFTASAGPLPDGATPPDTAYPVITLDTVITDDAGVICQQNPMNGEGSGVQADYYPLDRPPFRFFAMLGPNEAGDDVEMSYVGEPPEPEPAP